MLKPNHCPSLYLNYYFGKREGYDETCYLRPLTISYLIVSYLSYFLQCLCTDITSCQKYFTIFTLCKTFQFFIPFMKSSHLPEQLPGEHTGDIVDMSAFMLQCINLGKHIVSAFTLSHTTFHNSSHIEAQWLGMFRHFTHVLFYAPITQTR